MSEPRTKTGQRLDLAWPSTMDRLEWRAAIVAIEDETLALSQEVARDALGLLDAARRANVRLAPTEARDLAAALRESVR